MSNLYTFIIFDTGLIGDLISLIHTLSYDNYMTYRFIDLCIEA